MEKAGPRTPGPVPPPLSFPIFHRVVAPRSAPAPSPCPADKVLKELIEPYELRAAKLREFLADVQPTVLYDIVPLGDPYGPAVTDPELRCIVVSEETRKGGEAVNKKRLENVILGRGLRPPSPAAGAAGGSVGSFSWQGLAALELFEIQLIKDPEHGRNEEEKISSSSLRQRLLGTLLRPPRVRG